MSRLFFVKLALAVALLCGFAGNASAQVSGGLVGGGLSFLPEKVTAAPPLKVKKVAVKESQPDLRAAFFSEEITKALPRLGQNFKVLAPADKNYNAYAYAIGVNDRWINVEMGSEAEPLSGMDDFLGQAGYSRLEDLDTSLQRGMQKIVVYATVKPDGDIAQVQSVAVQMKDGSWSSKIGGMAVIGFAKLDQLNGPTYGRPIAVYVRQAPRGNTPRL